MTFDRERVVAWAGRRIGRVVSVTELAGGWTSTMLALSSSEESAVARLMTREPWRTHGEALTTREQQIQRMLAGSPVPAPRTLALDATGVECGVPAHLMTLLPGSLETQRRDSRSLEALARTLAAIHAIRPTVPVRRCQSWAWEAKFVVPAWSERPQLWETAFDLLRQEHSGSDWRFLHRDFQPRNVLWDDDRVVGVVDWVEASMGPRWLDVAHCSTHLALEHGGDTAAEFAAAYVALTGATADPYFDVMDIVGNLPAPGREALITAPDRLRALEDRLEVVLT